MVSQRAFLCTAGYDIMDTRHCQADILIAIENRVRFCTGEFVGQKVMVSDDVVLESVIGQWRNLFIELKYNISHGFITLS